MSSKTTLTSRVTGWLWAGIAVVLALYVISSVIHLNVHSLHRRVVLFFRVNHEANLPTWFNGSLLALIGVLAALAVQT